MRSNPNGEEAERTTEAEQQIQENNASNDQFQEDGDENQIEMQQRQSTESRSSNDASSDRSNSNSIFQTLGPRMRSLVQSARNSYRFGTSTDEQLSNLSEPLLESNNENTLDMNNRSEIV